MQTQCLKVTGMSCSGCAETVTGALKAVNGVTEVDVSLDAGRAVVQYDEKRTAPGDLKSAIEAAGYGVSKTATVGPRSEGCCCGGKVAGGSA